MSPLSLRALAIAGAAALVAGAPVPALGAPAIPGDSVPQVHHPAPIPEVLRASDTIRAAAVRAPRRAACDSLVASAAASGLHVTCAPATADHGQLRTPAMLFYGTVAVATAMTFRWKVDPDPGGYDDAWGTAASFPDKVVHGLAAFAVTEIGIDLGARPWLAAASVCAAGTAFEYSQGYVSRYDIAANCIGAATSALWRRLLHRGDDRRSEDR